MIRRTMNNQGLVVIVSLLLVVQTIHADNNIPSKTITTDLNENGKSSKTVKKELPPVGPVAENKPKDETIGISEPPVAPKTSINSDTKSPLLPVEDEESHHKLNIVDDDEFAFPDSYTAIFYIMVAITTSALLLLVVRVYRLRLSRAERKYGVQGDRANQELTPLPMAIEDVNSDDEDHTVFEVNRQNLRIL